MNSFTNYRMARPKMMLPLLEINLRGYKDVRPKIFMFNVLRDALCSMFAILIHFFGLSSFTWTLLEGIQLNKSIKV